MTISATNPNAEHSQPLNPEQRKEAGVFKDLADGVVRYAEANSDDSDAVIGRVHGFFNALYTQAVESGIKTSSDQRLDETQLDDQIVQFTEAFAERPEGSDPLDTTAYPDAMRSFPRADGLRQAMTTLLESPATSVVTQKYLQVVAAQRTHDTVQEEEAVTEPLTTFDSLSPDAQADVLAYKRVQANVQESLAQKNYAMVAEDKRQLFRVGQELSAEAKAFLGLS